MNRELPALLDWSRTELLALASFARFLRSEFYAVFLFLLFHSRGLQLARAFVLKGVGLQTFVILKPGDY
jgi:hypothetical protein